MVAVPLARWSSSRSWMYSVAPMSTPRVGCAATSTSGSRASSRAMTTFWMLPPDRLLIGVSMLGVLMRKSEHELAAAPGNGLKIEEGVVC